MKPEQAAELALALAGGALAVAAIGVSVPVLAWMRRVRYTTGKWPLSTWPPRMTRLAFVSGLLGSCGLFLCQIIWVTRLI
jgi:hypothetical protein